MAIMKYIIKLVGAVLALFLISLGAVLSIVFLVGIIVDRSADLFPLFLVSTGFIIFGFMLFKLLGYTIKQGIAAAAENIFWFI